MCSGYDLLEICVRNRKKWVDSGNRLLVVSALSGGFWYVFVTTKRLASSFCVRKQQEAMQPPNDVWKRGCGKGTEVGKDSSPTNSWTRWFRVGASSAPTERGDVPFGRVPSLILHDAHPVGSSANRLRVSPFVWHVVPIAWVAGRSTLQRYARWRPCKRYRVKQDFGD